jgi:hypothetical protein
VRLPDPDKRHIGERWSERETDSEMKSTACGEAKLDTYSKRADRALCHKGEC